MSMASRAFNRLRELWRINYDKNFRLNALRETYPSKFRSQNTCALLEQLEPRMMLSVAPTLPGLELVDPDVSKLAGQVIYLDFDGAEGVDYNGPVKIKNIDIPAFETPSALNGIEQKPVSTIMDDVASILSPLGITVTSVVPDVVEYSTVYIGGSGVDFMPYGDFYGLAEQIDIGNVDRSDSAFVFSDLILSDRNTEIVDVVVHEIGHLLGWEHQDGWNENKGILDKLAHKQEVHQYIIEEAVELFLKECPDLLLSADFNFSGSDDFGSQIRTAAWDEDEEPAPWGGDTYLGYNVPFREHFYDPDKSDSADHLNLASNSESALDRAELYWQTYVIDNYKSNDAFSAWYFLGRVAHLVADMTVPAHVHLDPHGNWSNIGLVFGDDQYEDYMIEVNDDNGSNPNYEQWDSSDTISSILSYSSLAQLFYYTAERTDDFDSDGVDGEFSGSDDINIGKVDYQYCQIYGNTLMPLAFNATARLFKMFVEEVRPSISISLPSSSTSSVTISASPDGIGSMGIDIVDFQYSTNPSDPNSWDWLTSDTSATGGWNTSLSLSSFSTGATIYFRAQTRDNGGVYSDWSSLVSTTKSSTLSSISISGPNSVTEGDTANYTCTAHYSDGSNADITSSVDWSENSPFASIDASGELTAGNLNPSDNHSCTLTASYGGKTGTYSIQIKDVITVPTELSYAISDGKVTITGCDMSASGEMIIPDTIEGLPVTSIGDNAFFYCDLLTSVTIPDGVTSIGKYAFQLCTNLTNVTIPDSVTSIDEGTFENCNRLTDITIPDSVISIGSGAFYGCNLSNVTIGNGVTSIGDEAFLFCGGLKNITIPDSVTSIGYRAFCGCGMTNVMISKNITSIGEQAFGRCGNLVSIVVAPDNANYSSSNGVLLNKTGTTLLQYPAGEIGGYTISSGIISIGDGAFCYCRNLTSVTIPSSVISIGHEAFCYSDSLTSVTIPDSVTTIGEKTFYSCDSLTSMIISDSVTSIGERAFYDCDGLMSVIIGKSVISISEKAFYSCDNLTSATFEGNAPSMGSDIFKNCASGFTIYYYAGTTGFTQPTWQGYSSQKLTGVAIPVTPTNVSASDGKYTDKVHITWTTSSGATSYEIKRIEEFSADPNGNPQTFTSTTNSFDDTTAVAGTYYIYSVKAINSAGSSAYSTGDYGNRQTSLPPTNIVLSSFNVVENQPIGTVVGTLSGTDPDAGQSDTLTFSLVSGYADNGQFAIDSATKQLKTAAAFNYETKNSYSVKVRATDTNGLTFDKTFTINVNNVNEDPTTIALSNTNVAENLPSGTAIGTLSTTDVDSGNTFTYSLVSGTGSTDNASFTISGNTLKTTAAFNFEAKNSYSIRVRSTDQGSLSTEKVFTIGVTNINETPVASNLSASGAIDEQIHGQLAASDVDGDTLLFTVDDETAHGQIVVQPNGAFTYTPNSGYAGPDTFTFTVSDSVNAPVQGTVQLMTGNRIAFDAKGRLTYRDADGDNVTVAIAGGGSGYALLSDSTGDDALGIFLSNTTAKTTLSFAVKADKVFGGTGYTTIGGLEVDGLIKSIAGSYVNLIGDVILNTGSDTVTAKDSVSIVFSGVEDFNIDTNGIGIKTLTLAGSMQATYTDVDDSITAPWINTIKVSGRKDNAKTAANESLDGNFAASLVLDGADAKGYALNSATVKGLWTGSVNAGASFIGGINVGIWRVDLTAGYLKSLTTKAIKGTPIDGDANGTITIGRTDAKGNAIGTLSIGGNADGLIINAGSGVITTISIGQWTTGSLTAGVIKTIAAKDDKARNAVNGDFGINVTLDSAWYNRTFKPVSTTLNSASIAGQITGGKWNINGNLGSVSVSRAVTDWELDADNAKSLTFGGLFDSEIDIDNRIDGISVKGWSVAKGQEIPTFTSGSTIAADFIKSASLFNWDTTDMTQLLVPEVGDIAALTYTDTRPASKTKWTWKPGQPEKWSNAIEPIEYVG